MSKAQRSTASKTGGEDGRRADENGREASIVENRRAAANLPTVGSIAPHPCGKGHEGTPSI